MSSKIKSSMYTKKESNYILLFCYGAISCLSDYIVKYNWVIMWIKFLVNLLKNYLIDLIWSFYWIHERKVLPWAYDFKYGHSKWFSDDLRRVVGGQAEHIILGLRVQNYI